MTGFVVDLVIGFVVGLVFGGLGVFMIMVESDRDIFQDDDDL